MYRCLDRVLSHKQEVIVKLKQKWANLFHSDIEVLLYDLTSTYFKGEMVNNPKFTTLPAPPSVVSSLPTLGIGASTPGQMCTTAMPYSRRSAIARRFSPRQWKTASDQIPREFARLESSLARGSLIAVASRIIGTRIDSRLYWRERSNECEIWSGRGGR